MKGKQATLYAYESAGLYETFLVNTTVDTTGWVLDFDAVDQEATDPTASVIAATPTIDNTTKVITLTVDVADLVDIIETGETEKILKWRIRVNPGSGYLSFFYGDLVLRLGGSPT